MHPEQMEKLDPSKYDQIKECWKSIEEFHKELNEKTVHEIIKTLISLRRLNTINWNYILENYIAVEITGLSTGVKADTVYKTFSVKIHTKDRIVFDIDIGCENEKPYITLDRISYFE